MLVETVEEFLSRGGSITEVPMGVMTQGSKDIKEYSWDTKSSLGPLSDPNKPKLQPRKVEKKVRQTTETELTYLAYLKAHPGFMPRHIAEGLGWKVQKVNDTKKSCVKHGLHPIGDTKLYLNYVEKHPMHKRQQIAEALGWTCEKVSDVRQRCIDSQLKLVTNANEKQCFTCKKVRVLKLFNKNKSKKDGLQSQCSDCQAKAMSNWRANKAQIKKEAKA